LARDMIFKDARHRCVISFAVSVVLVTAAFCGTGESRPERAEPDKTGVLRQVGLEWIEVGMVQQERRLYSQAERSFLTAKEYEQYLTADELSRLNERLQKAHRCAVAKEQVLEQLRTAEELVRKGQPIKARAHFEEIRNSEYLSKRQRVSITEQLKDIDRTFDRRQAEITALYNRSVEYYRAGQMEKAREGFLAVSKYGLLVVPAGHRPEDYLAAIDNVLMSRLSRLEPSVPAPTNRFEPVFGGTGRQSVEAADTSAAGGAGGAAGRSEKRNTKYALEAKSPAGTFGQDKNPNPTKSEAISVAAPPEQYEIRNTKYEIRANIIHGYTKAVLTDTASKVSKHLTNKEYNQAMEAVKRARTLVRRNRSWLGEELYEQYIGWLGQLSEKILSEQSGKRKK